jgi:hypothetical protein
MSKINPQKNLDEKYDEDEYFEKSKKQKYTKPKFKKKLSKWGKKFNKQSDYRKRAKKKK